MTHRPFGRFQASLWLVYGPPSERKKGATMRATSVLASALACAIAVALMAGPARAQEYSDCYRATTDKSLTEKGVDICTHLIASGRWKGDDLAQLYNNRGLLHSKLDKLELAVNDLSQALKNNPKDAHAYDNLGDIWYARRDYDKAVVEYNNAIRVDPTFIGAYYNRGRAFEAMGNLRSARADYQAVLNMPGQDRAIDRWAKDRARDALNRLNKT
jgi:tetratricopeptide (TPR) repeat protein